MFINKKKFLIFIIIFIIISVSLSYYGFKKYNNLIIKNKNSKESDINTDFNFMYDNNIVEIEKKLKLEEVKKDEKSLINKKVLMAKKEDRNKIKKDFLIENYSEEFLNTFIKFNREGLDILYTHKDILNNYFSKEQIEDLSLQSVFNDNKNLYRFLNENFDLINEEYKLFLKNLNENFYKKIEEMYKKHLENNEKLKDTEDFFELENNKVQLIINKDNFNNEKKILNEKFENNKKNLYKELNLIIKLKSGLLKDLNEEENIILNTIFERVSKFKFLKVDYNEKELNNILNKKYLNDYDFKDFINEYSKSLKRINTKDLSEKEINLIYKLFNKQINYNLITNKRFIWEDITEEEINLIYKNI